MRRAFQAFARLAAIQFLALVAMAGSPSPAAVQVDLVLNVVDAPDPVPAGVRGVLPVPRKRAF